jgi:hypothetical protein
MLGISDYNINNFTNALAVVSIKTQTFYLKAGFILENTFTHTVHQLLFVFKAKIFQLS